MLQKIENQEPFKEEFQKIMEIHVALEKDSKTLKDGFFNGHIRRDLTSLETKQLDKQIRELKYALHLVFCDLQELCEEHNRYSVFSTYIDFKNKYKTRLAKFISDYQGSIESDYIEHQINIYQNLPEKFYFLKEELLYSCKRKIEFLNARLFDINSPKVEKTSKALTNRETIFLLDSLGILKKLADNPNPLNKVQIGKIFGLILGRNPQGIRELLSKTSLTEGLGDTELSKIEEIKLFMNKL